MGYEYRVFIDSPNGDTDAKHYADEKLYEGAIFRVNKPGTEIHGKPVLVHRVDSTPVTSPWESRGRVPKAASRRPPLARVVVARPLGRKSRNHQAKAQRWARSRISAWRFSERSEIRISTSSSRIGRILTRTAWRPLRRPIRPTARPSTSVGDASAKAMTASHSSSRSMARSLVR